MKAMQICVAFALVLLTFVVTSALCCPNKYSNRTLGERLERFRARDTSVSRPASDSRIRKSDDSNGCTPDSRG